MSPPMLQEYDYPPVLGLQIDGSDACIKLRETDIFPVRYLIGDL